MPDIAVVWNNLYGTGDWVFAPGGDLQSGSDLATAITVSIFTDADAGPDFTPTDGTTDRRGWWGDAYEAPDRVGSKLWTLERSKKTTTTLNLAQTYVEAALAWLVDDGVAAAVDVQTQWIGTALIINVLVTEPGGNILPFNYSYVWNEV